MGWSCSCLVRTRNHRGMAFKRFPMSDRKNVKISAVITPDCLARAACIYYRCVFCTVHSIDSPFLDAPKLRIFVHKYSRSTCLPIVRAR